LRRDGRNLIDPFQLFTKAKNSGLLEKGDQNQTRSKRTISKQSSEEGEEIKEENHNEGTNQNQNEEEGKGKTTKVIRSRTKATPTPTNQDSNKKIRYQDL